MTTELPWRALTVDDLTEVSALAGRCLIRDGGLPLAAEASFLGRRFAAPECVAWGVPDNAGGLLAAGTVRPREIDGVRRAVFFGLVDPDWRGRGLGAALLDQGLVRAGASPKTCRWRWSRSPGRRGSCSPAAVCGRCSPRT